MILEAKLLKLDKKNPETFQIAIGKRIAIVKLDKMVAEVKLDDGSIKLIKINRKKINKRMRPNPEERFREQGNEVANLDGLNLINAKDLEWMAWNWRAMMI